MNSRRQEKETLVTWYKFWRKREENAEKNYGVGAVSYFSDFSLQSYWRAKSKRASREKWRKPEEKK